MKAASLSRCSQVRSFGHVQSIIEFIEPAWCNVVVKREPRGIFGIRVSMHAMASWSPLVLIYEPPRWRSTEADWWQSVLSQSLLP